jgi:hypothetical protein
MCDGVIKFREHSSSMTADANGKLGGVNQNHFITFQLTCTCAMMVMGDDGKNNIRPLEHHQGMQQYGYIQRGRELTKIP